MKTNKINLITEINYINRLMGNNLLLEQWHLLLDDAIQAAKSLSIRRSGKLSKNFDNFISAAEAAAKNGDEANFLLNLKKAADESKEFSEYLRPKVLSSIEPSQRKNIDDHFDRLMDDISKRKLKEKDALLKMDKGIDGIIGGPFDEVRDLLKKEYRDKITKESPKGFIKTTADEFWNKLTFKDGDTVYSDIFKEIWNITGGNLNKKWVKRIEPGFWSRAAWWLTTGSTKNLAKELVKIFGRQKGFHIVLAEYTGAALARWVKIYIALAILNLIKEISNDNPEVLGDYEFWADVENSWPKMPNIYWTIPAPVFWDFFFEVKFPRNPEESKEFWNNLNGLLVQFTQKEKQAWEELEKQSYGEFYDNINKITPTELDNNPNELVKIWTNRYSKYGYTFKGSSKLNVGFETFEDQIEITLPDGKTKKPFDTDNTTIERDAATAKKIKQFMLQGIVDEGTQTFSPNLDVKTPKIPTVGTKDSKGPQDPGGM